MEVTILGIDAQTEKAKFAAAEELMSSMGYSTGYSLYIGEDVLNTEFFRSAYYETDTKALTFAVTGKLDAAGMLSIANMGKGTIEKVQVLDVDQVTTVKDADFIDDMMTKRKMKKLLKRRKAGEKLFTKAVY